MRIDKYLWAVRLFKTRSQATKACSKDQARLNGQVVKPSRLVGLGDEFQVRDLGHWRSYKVLGTPKSRVGAKLVPDYMIEITPQETLDQIQAIQDMNRENRQYGLLGRPTKKTRRDLDKFSDGW